MQRRVNLFDRKPFWHIASGPVEKPTAKIDSVIHTTPTLNLSFMVLNLTTPPLIHPMTFKVRGRCKHKRGIQKSSSYSIFNHIYVLSSTATAGKKKIICTVSASDNVAKKEKIKHLIRKDVC